MHASFANVQRRGHCKVIDEVTGLYFARLYAFTRSGPMRSALLALTLVLSCGVATIGQRGAAAKPDSSPPRLPDGQYDLEGVWDFSTITPLERPSSLANKQTLTDEEAAVFEREENQRQNRDRSEEGGRPVSARQRHSLQRVLVRARQQDHRRQAHFAHRRSAGRPDSSAHARRAEEARCAGRDRA